METEAEGRTAGRVCVGGVLCEICGRTYLV